MGADADGGKKKGEREKAVCSFVAVRDELPDDYRAVINDDDKIHRTVQNEAVQRHKRTAGRKYVKIRKEKRIQKR